MAKNMHAELLRHLGKCLEREELKDGEFYVAIPRERADECCMFQWYPTSFEWFSVAERIIRTQLDHYGKMRVSIERTGSCIDTQRIYNREDKWLDPSKFYFMGLNSSEYDYRPDRYGVAIEEYMQDHYIYSSAHLEYLEKDGYNYEKGGTKYKAIPLRDKLEQLASEQEPYAPLPITRTETQMEFSIGLVNFRFREFNYELGGWSNYGGLHKGDCCYFTKGSVALGVARRHLEESGAEVTDIDKYASRYLADDGKVYMLQVQAEDGEWYYTARYMYKGCLRTCGVHLFNAITDGSCSSSQFPDLEGGRFGTRIPNTGWSALTSYTGERLWRYYPTGYGHAS